MRRFLRWTSLAFCLACLAKAVFGRTDDFWALSGFFLTGALWYWLTWKRTRELDAPHPR